jgi:hypothetical protein
MTTINLLQPDTELTSELRYTWEDWSNKFCVYFIEDVPSYDGDEFIGYGATYHEVASFTNEQDAIDFISNHYSN